MNKIRQEKKQPLTDRLHLLHLPTATAPHRKLQPAKLRDAADVVCEGVGCTRRQSQAARNDSRGALVYMRASMTGGHNKYLVGPNIVGKNSEIYRFWSLP